MIRRRSAQALSEPVTEHGEGPLWNATAEELWLVDLLAGDLLRLSSSGILLSRQHVDAVLAAVRPRQAGGLIAGIERGFAALDDDGTMSTWEVWDDTTVRMNDGACDTQGRFYCGSMAYDTAPGRGKLYRLNHDGSVTVVLDGVTISNGLAFTTDGKHALYVDSATQEIRRYDLPDDDGPWRDFQTMVEIPGEAGTPDGICLDREGGVWVALWDGGAIHRYGPDGRLTDVVEVPTARPTACTLGGAGDRDLFITTSRLGVNDSGDSAAGSVFRATVDIPGSAPFSSAW